MFLDYSNLKHQTNRIQPASIFLAIDSDAVSDLNKYIGACSDFDQTTKLMNTPSWNFSQMANLSAIPKSKIKS